MNTRTILSANRLFIFDLDKKTVKELRGIKDTGISKIHLFIFHPDTVIRESLEALMLFALKNNLTMTIHVSGKKDKKIIRHLVPYIALTSKVHFSIAKDDFRAMINEDTRLQVSYSIKYGKTRGYVSLLSKGPFVTITF